MQYVLQLDVRGTPQAWISPEEAASHYASDGVAWELGDSPLITLRGGYNSVLGRQSMLVISPIIATRGMPKRNLFESPPGVTKAKLLKRDRCMCAYCGETFRESDLQAEHIVPDCKDGPYSWMNLVAACAYDNSRKANRTPEEAGMPLLYLPYVPTKYEDFLLRGRNTRADVHEWLASKLPKGSRLI